MWLVISLETTKNPTILASFFKIMYTTNNQSIYISYLKHQFQQYFSFTLTNYSKQDNKLFTKL